MRGEGVEELRHLLVQGVSQPPVVHSLALQKIVFPLFYKKKNVAVSIIHFARIPSVHTLLTL